MGLEQDTSDSEVEVCVRPAPPSGGSVERVVGDDSQRAYLIGYECKVSFKSETATKRHDASRAPCLTAPSTAAVV